MDLKKLLQVLGIVALSLFVIQLILGLIISFTIGGFIIKVDITDDQDSIHINSDFNKKNKTKERVLIIIDNDTIVNIQKNN